MATVYILYSGSLNKYYIGSTALAVQDRLRRHNSNHKGFTGKRNDWEIKFVEMHSSIREAQKREKQIKRWKSKPMIEALINQAK